MRRGEGFYLNDPHEGHEFESCVCERCDWGGQGCVMKIVNLSVF